MAAPTSPRALLAIPNSAKDSITSKISPFDSQIEEFRLMCNPNIPIRNMPARIQQRLYRAHKVHRPVVEAQSTSSDKTSVTGSIVHMADESNGWNDSELPPWGLNTALASDIALPRIEVNLNNTNTLAASLGDVALSWDTYIDTPTNPAWQDHRKMSVVAPRDANALVRFARSTVNKIAKITTKNPVQFDFLKLPKELQLYLLRFFLTAPDGIVNPWLQDTPVTFNGSTTHVIYSWSKSMRPSILATNRELRKIGTPYLYDVNVFRFTRRVSSIPGFENDPENISEFLQCLHGLHGPLDDPVTTINRGNLIKNVVLQDSDHFNDNLAARGYAWALPSEPEDLRYGWQFSTLRRLEWLGCNLTKLSITFDQASPLLKSHLKFETEMRELSLPSEWLDMHKIEEVEARNDEWHNLRENSTQPFPLPPYTYIDSVDGLRIKELYIHGTAPHDGNIRFFPNQKLHSNGEMAVIIKEWIFMTGIYPQIIDFTGAFDKHELNSVDSWVNYDSPSPATEAPAAGFQRLNQYFLGSYFHFSLSLFRPLMNAANRIFEAASDISSWL